ncbi:MAG: S-layer homology domain-containing protein [Armatimonadota bacterium]
MLKMKYLWTLALVALCVSLASGMAFAQDSWAIGVDADDEPLVDLPSGLGWDQTYEATVGALNDGSTTWTKAAGYQLLSAEGTTDVGLILTDRWGFPAVDLGGTDSIAPDDQKDFAFTITAPPISGTFDCNWIMGVGGMPIDTALAEGSVTITRFPDTTAGTAGEWASPQIEGCAGRLPAIVLGFTDGLYRPTQLVNRGTMAVYIRRGMGIPELNPAEPTFSDVPADFWSYKDIEALADAGVVAGYGDGTYQPAWLVTRGQMAKFIALGAGLTVEAPEDITEDVFPDVPADYWSANFIKACKDANIVLGYTDGLYRPGNNVSRDQMAVYAYKAFIGTTTNAVILGGPGLTNVDLTTVPAYHGWSSAGVDPVWAYVEFDAAAVGPGLAGAGTWDIVFEFASVDTPTTIEDSVGVSLDAADLTGITGTYFTVAAKRPNMTPGQKIMYTTVEGKDGTPYKLARTVTFELLEPPPPPGAPRPPNALGGTLWVDAGADDRSDAAEYFSGTFANMKFSDDMYYVMHQKMLPMTESDWSQCCVTSGFTLKWTGLEIPVTATEMKLTLEYRGGGVDADQNQMPCDWCSEPSNNMCEEWGGYNDDPTDPPLDLVWWIDGVHVNYGWGLVMVNFTDPWDWTNAEIQNTPAEGGGDDPNTPEAEMAFCYHPFGNDPSADMVMTWSVPIATALADFVQDDGGTYTAAIHWCSATLPYVYVDQCMLSFEPYM